jgi:hypothetical protein
MEQAAAEVAEAGHARLPRLEIHQMLGGERMQHGERVAAGEAEHSRGRFGFHTLTLTVRARACNHTGRGARLSAS